MNQSPSAPTFCCATVGLLLTHVFYFSPPKVQGEEPFSAQLRQSAADLLKLDAPARLELLGRLRTLGSDSVSAVEPLLDIWRQADGDTDDEMLARVLDVFRAMGRTGAPAAEPLSAFLPHESQVYQGRDQLEVTRLRSYLMVTLGELGLPAGAYPYLLDSLAHFDERLVAVEIGSAARALQSEVRRARKFIAYLVKVIPNESGEEEFSLARYAVDFPNSEATTAQLEAIRTLSVVCRADDEAAINVLQRLANAPQRSRWDERAIGEAKKALGAIRLRHAPTTSRK
jgi:hypothetical protein